MPDPPYTHYTADDLAMAERHVAQGEEHVAKQEELLERMRRQGHPTVVAEDLLATFVSTLDEHRAHRDLISQALRSR